MPVITFSKTTTTVTTVTTFSIDVPTALPAKVRPPDSQAASADRGVACLPKAVAAPTRGSDRRTLTEPRSALAKLEAKELKQARAEKRLSAYRHRENAERMAQYQAGAVCFD